jgi:hypothetical protein
MPAEFQALGGDDLAKSIKRASVLGPLGLATLSLAKRRRRRVDRLNAQPAAQPNRSYRIGAQPVEADMRARHRQTM